MIGKGELNKAALENNVPITTIDKDWMLGHFLNAMYSFEHVRRELILKGGTCLRKLYFAGYRFSEDLDFTFLNRNFEIDEREVHSWIDSAEKSSRGRLCLWKINEKLFDDEFFGYEIIIRFWGAKQSLNKKPPEDCNRWHDKIKLDISTNEYFDGNICIKEIIHPYSDGPLKHPVSAYSLHEILAEKLRSLIQRNRPRDIFDIWFLSRIIKPHELNTIQKILTRKAAHKKISFSGYSDFVSDKKKKINSKEWTSSLVHQINRSTLPDANKAYDEVCVFVEKVINSKP